MFLDSIREKQEEEERIRREMDGVEIKGFRECVTSIYATSLTVNHFSRAVAARVSAANAAPLEPISKPAAKPPPAKKDAKKGKSLKGLIMKKKAKPATTTTAAPQATSATKDKPPSTSKPVDEDLPNPKRRKLASP